MAPTVTSDLTSDPTGDATSSQNSGSERTSTGVIAVAKTEHIAPRERPTLAELFAAHVAFVWRVLASHGVHEADIEDSTQEVFLTAHRRMEQWDPERASARTWLYAIAIRFAANYRRLARVRYEQPADETEPPPHEADADAHLDRRRLLAKLDATLAAMSEDKRSVFVLFELEGLQMIEVAKVVGCPVQTAYARLYAARRLVVSALGRGT